MRKLMALALLLPMTAAAYEAPTNVAAVRDGTSMTVTWEHSGDAKAFSVWQFVEGSPNKIFSGSQVYGGESRTSTFTVPSVAEVPQLCDLYVVARYLPEQPNQASERVCATDGATEPPPEPSAGEGRTVRWTPPTEREDGTPLPPGELKGHWVHYALTTPPVDTPIFVPMPETSLRVEGLTPGTWYFAVAAEDSEGVQSNLAFAEPEVIPEPAPPGDEMPPFIELNGDYYEYVQIRKPWIDPGATCIDDVDGDISENITVEGTVDVSTLGEYMLTYRCADTAGNEYTRPRLVTVIKRAAPKAPSEAGTTP